MPCTAIIWAPGEKAKRSFISIHFSFFERLNSAVLFMELSSSVLGISYGKGPTAAQLPSL